MVAALAQSDDRVILDDDAAAARWAAEWLLASAAGSDGEAVICLAGGSTPRMAYRLLAEPPLRDRFPWQRVHWVFGDERMVPHDHERSNYRMVREALFDRVAIPAGHVHPVPTELGDAATAAAAYEKTLMQLYGAAQRGRAKPLFAATLLGIGEDGHTASLFPGSAALKEAQRWTASVLPGGGLEPRVTLTRPALESSAELVFLATGAAKRGILKRLWQAENLPAASIHPVGRLRWVVDHAAAGATGV
jgi:6-phosphogluconolactonase